MVGLFIFLYPIAELSLTRECNVGTFFSVTAAGTLDRGAHDNSRTAGANYGNGLRSDNSAIEGISFSFVKVRLQTVYPMANVIINLIPCAEMLYLCNNDAHFQFTEAGIKNLNFNRQRI